MGEPAQNQRVRIGVWVLLFLGVFTRDRLAPERGLLERRHVTRHAVRPSPGTRPCREWAAAGAPLFLISKESPTMMVLYSGTTCPFSHRCRFVLFEKGMDFEIRDVDLFNKPEDIA